MRRIIGLRELLQVEVGVALGGAEAGVAQELLDGAQIHAAVQQVGREAVAQGMGADLRPHRCGLQGLGEEIPH